MFKLQLKRKLLHRLNAYRHSLAYIDALPQLTLLGLIIGLFTGGIVAIFRLLIELPLSQFLASTPDDFESLSPLIRIAFIFGGIGVLLIILYSVKKSQREISVGHVIDRLHNHQGHMPKTNWLVQFIGAIVSIISGQSVGREGPAVHLGAGAASQLGLLLKLPNNSMNTLIGCGVASAIATSFNTPLAGVIFAMEVIIKEYTIVGFVPVILASVMGTMLSRAIFSGEGDLQFGNTEISTLLEMPYMVLIGLIISVLASSYTRLHIMTLKHNTRPLYLRLLAAGAIMSAGSLAAPEIMGLGYDTINSATQGDILVGSLIVIVIAKLVVTPVIIGLGVPGGVIGPSLMIGACTGAIFGIAMEEMVPNLGANSAFYVLMGMAGMMAAVLNAPLAALVAVLELSYNPNTIFPAMLVIVVSCVSTRQFFKLRGIFIEQLKHSKRNLDFSPAKQALRRAGIRSVMNTRFAEISRVADYKKILITLNRKPDWLIFSTESEIYSVRAADVSRHLEELIEEQGVIDEEIDLLAIPGRRHTMAAIEDSATLLESLKVFRAKSTQALYVTQVGPRTKDKIQGIVILSDVENYYQPKELRNAVG